jgi:UDP-glucose 4-epimerase
VNIYITGIAGLVGSNLARKLLINKHHVRGCDTLIGGYEDNIPKNAAWTQTDILNQEEMVKELKDVDVIVHTAALPYEGLSVFSPSLVVQNIVGGTVSLASAAIQNNVRRFIFCSSMARYGAQTPPFKEHYEKKPVDPYGMGKAQAEDMLFLLNEIHGLEVVIAVPHNIIGVGQRYTDPYRNVAAIMINSTYMNNKIYVYGDGEQKRSFSDISDCINALAHMVVSDRNLHREVYNIGPDKNEISIRELAESVSELTNKEPKLIYVPDRPREVKNAYCSSDKIKKEFNYNASVPLTDTLTSMIEWIQERKPQPFNYHLPIEITNRAHLPRTWTDKLF